MDNKIVSIPGDPISVEDFEKTKFFPIVLNFAGVSVNGYTARFTYQDDNTIYFDDKTSDPADQSIVVHYKELPADAPSGKWDLALVELDDKGKVGDVVNSEEGQHVNVANP